MMDDGKQETMLYRGRDIKTMSAAELVDAMLVLYSELEQERKNHRQTLSLFAPVNGRVS